MTVGGLGISKGGVLRKGGRMDNEDQRDREVQLCDSQPS
jgi:hypothetical protein